MSEPMPEFVPGLRLSEAFFREAVQPILATEFPDLRYAAALMGYGSDVLGYDTRISTDHEWGPRLLLFLDDRAIETYAGAIDEALRQQLPPTFGGYSTHFSVADPIQWRAPWESGPVNHKVWIQTVGSFIRRTLDFEWGAEIGLLDWLVFPEQRLLEITQGRVFHDDLGGGLAGGLADGLGELATLRARFAYYPRDIWLYLLAAQWSAIAQEEAFMARAGDAGDDLGSRVIGARQVQRLMKLAFLMERRYAPYSKWFGAAFARLPCAGELGPVLQNVLAAENWQTREQHLGAAYTQLADFHNALQITEPLDTGLTNYYDRPYQVLFADRFAEVIGQQIEDPVIRALPRGLGAIDQISHNVDILCDARLCGRLRALFA